MRYLGCFTLFCPRGRFCLSTGLFISEGLFINEGHRDTALLSYDAILSLCGAQFPLSILWFLLSGCIYCIFLCGIEFVYRCSREDKLTIQSRSSFHALYISNASVFNLHHEQTLYNNLIR
jgi:hypothetical protein